MNATEIEAGTEADVPPGPSGDPATTGTTSIVRWLGWLVPLAVFAWFFDVRLLVVTRVFPLLSGDWSTYIAAPNFVRGAPWVSWPIGRIPGYLSPVGTWLGQVDAWPVLYPVYRVLGIAMPHRPFQLIGWELLASVVLTFWLTRRYLRDESRDGGVGPLRAELAAAAGAVVLLAQPYYVLRFGHVSLFQMWVLVWALIFGGHVLEAQRHGRPAAATWRFVAPVVAASVCNPYLALMVIAVTCVPLLATWRGDRRATAVRLVASIAALGITSWALGYIGTPGRSGSLGFGLYYADLSAPLDDGDRSRLWPSFAGSGVTEGYGFPGVAVIGLAVVAAVAALVRRRRSGSVGVRAWTWPLWLAVGLLALWAAMPRLKVRGHTVVDLTWATDRFDALGDTTRANGRFAWPLLWLVGLTVTRWFVRQRRVAALVVLAVAAVVGVVDLGRIGVPSSHPHYGNTFAVVRAAASTGATRVEFQPPLVVTDCHNLVWGDFGRISPVVVAAATEGLDVNSGYPARGSDEFLHRICEADAQEYARGELAADVLYILPPDTAPVSPGLRCEPMEIGVQACRLAAPADLQGLGG